jgi:predicted 3-demethylubiquinone-9 3-methyltransferase (glyoxalase superfamily)
MGKPDITFIGINGGPQFPFSEAVSFTIGCKDQDEVDHYWSRLTDDGEESQCGWCKDRFGLGWQIVPDRLCELVSHRMRKIVIADLEDAVAAV